MNISRELPYDQSAQHLLRSVRQPKIAHRVISQHCSISVAFGAKRKSARPVEPTKSVENDSERTSMSFVQGYSRNERRGILLENQAVASLRAV
jgi:hypothetical protein